MDDIEMKAFLLIVRRAMLMVVRWIENKYHIREVPSEYDDKNG
jgi:hypothetical protein